MVLRRLKTADLSDLDTKQRIMEAAIHLFAVKGFDGASIREIAKLANVNVASMNYYFKSKENLRLELLEYVVSEFKDKIRGIAQTKSASEYAVKVFEVLTSDSARCLNQFKLILEAEHHPCETDPYPIGYEAFSVYLERELKGNVPMPERLWLTNVVFSYILHTAVMSSTNVGKDHIEKFLPEKRASIPVYIRSLVEALIKDLNGRY